MKYRCIGREPIYDKKGEVHTGFALIYQLSGTPDLAAVKNTLPGTDKIPIGSSAFAPRNGKSFTLSEDDNGIAAWTEDV